MDVIEVTNAKENCRMDFPDGVGNNVVLKPGESKTILGDINYFEKLKPVVRGLVVKLIGSDRDEQVESSLVDLVEVEVTNHHVLPKASMAIGNGKSIRLGVGETKKVIGRESIIKQNQGISCKVIRRFSSLDETGEIRSKSDVIRAEIGLPVAVEDFIVLAKEHMTASDLVGIARRIGIKARSTKGLIEGITKTLYGSE